MYPKPSVLPQVGFEKTRPNKHRAVLIWQDRVPLHLKVWESQGGSGGSEKHIWKIFYRGDPKIGTPGTPRGSHGTKIFF